MINIDVELNNIIPGLWISEDSGRINIPSSKSKHTSASNHWHLPHLLLDGASPQERDGATIILPFGQRKAHNHQKVKLRL